MTHIMLFLARNAAVRLLEGELVAHVVGSSPIEGSFATIMAMLRATDHRSTPVQATEASKPPTTTAGQQVGWGGGRRAMRR